ncbi:MULTISPECIES: hypothetical protein [Acidithiobacillus]|uniref:hypothetical protein n=1 Tax=Acidithiobacillus TaxID=119977 RepID=UPI0004E28448|nr:MULTISPECIES: hypothetical protein [Acidithiobacillus]MDD2750719.1 hypothetical protein [Acidithiobacillus sp.]
MDRNDIWHYPRTDLAQKYVETLNIGLSNALALFAPRRMGKTEFLRKDLTPAAEAAGYWVIYVSLWEVKGDPGRALIKEIQAKEQSLLRKAVQKVRTGPKLKFGAGFMGAEGSLTVGGEEDKKISSQDLIELGEVMRHLAEGKRPVLLLIDEVQTLAEEARYGALVAALRSALDKYKDRIKAIFTGSSQDGLRQMFNREKAPLYQFSQQLSFPLMDRPFVTHLLGTYKKITRNKLDENRAWQAFEELERVPLYFRSLLEKMVLTGSQDFDIALQEVRENIEKAANYPEKWEGFSPMDKAVLLQIIDSGKVYGKEHRANMDHYLGIPIGTTKVSIVQQSIRRLMGQGVITNSGESGSYSIEDPTFLAWVCKSEKV